MWLDDVEVPGIGRVQHHVLTMPRPSTRFVVTDERGRFLLLWRHRFITDTWGWEVPAGWAEPGEAPEAAGVTGSRATAERPLPRVPPSRRACRGLLGSLSMTDVESMADHWWWRPGWRLGARFLTWHLTFEDAPQVHRVAADYRRILAGVPGLDLVPDPWLHLTMQGLGFADDVADRDVAAIVDAARVRLARIPGFEVSFDRPAVTPEAVRWEAAPGEPVAAVRDAIRAAIGEVWAEVPERADGFGPHISIAYSGSDRPAAPVLAAIAAAPSAPATARITHADLILLNRDHRMYEWEPVANIPLG